MLVLGLVLLMLSSTDCRKPVSTEERMLACGALPLLPSSWLAVPLALDGGGKVGEV